MALVVMMTEVIFGEHGLVAARVCTAVVAEPFAVSVVRVGWWRGLSRAQLLVVRVGRAGSGGGRRVVAVVRARAVLIHGHEDGCRFEQLHLLVFGNEQFGRILPLRRVLPTIKLSDQHVAPHITTIGRETHRCLFKQLPCLYALPQCSHFRSPVAALSFLVRRVPSLARRIFGFDLSEYDESGGPSTSALPPPLPLALRSAMATCGGRLPGKAPSFSVANAPFDMDDRRWTAPEASATACSTAAPSAAALAAGENVELFLRAMRLWPPAMEPSDTLCECVRL